MIDENNYLKHRTICKKCHNENKRKNNNNTTTESEVDTTPHQPKNDKIIVKTKMFQLLKIELMLLLAQET